MLSVMVCEVLPSTVITILTSSLPASLFGTRMFTSLLQATVKTEGLSPDHQPAVRLLCDSVLDSPGDGLEIVPRVLTNHAA